MTPPDAGEPAKPASRKSDRRTRKQAGEAAGRTGQRPRLLHAIVEVVAQDGFSRAKIAAIAKRAGVSRATFYEQFKNKEECFLAAHRELADRIGAEIAAAVAKGGASSRARAVLRELVELAEREPLAFSFLTHEGMLAGPRALEERDLLIAGLEEQIEHAWEQLPEGTPTPDIPARLLLAGVIRVLGLRIRRGEETPARLLPDLIAWMDSYSVPLQARRWRRMAPDELLLDADRDVSPASLKPQSLPRGRHRLPPAVVDRVQRERILHATADVVRAKGYANTTVANIVAVAGLSREVFYAHYHGKREAFGEAYKHGFEQTLVMTAEAFFTSSGAWPERVWESGLAFTRFIVSVPSLAHLGFVESYSLGPVETRRTDDTLLGFTVFLEDGYSYRPQADQVPRLVSEALAGAVMETVASYVRHGRLVELQGLVPIITYVILAPFTGTDAACEFVDRKVSEIQADNT